MLVNSKQAAEDVVKCIRAGLVPMLSGSPGIGKSDIVKAIAKKFKLHLIDIRLSQCDPVDLSGFPTIKDGVATYTPMDIFPLAPETVEATWSDGPELMEEGFTRVTKKTKPDNDDEIFKYTRGGTPIPKGKTGFLIFLDEINSAALSVQAAAYKFVLDREVGQHKLHPNAAIVCAGNLSTDGAITNRVSTAMQSRLVHLELAVDIDSWIAWANTNGIDHRIVSYVYGRPDNLHNFDPKHHDKTFACPRTWEFASKLIKKHDGDLNEMTALLAGTVSEAVAREFISYTSIYDKLPTIDQIVAHPLTVAVEDEPALLYALAQMIAAHAKKSTLPAIMKYTDRMPLEFETITLQGIVRKDKTMIKEKPVRDWIDAKGADLFLI